MISAMVKENQELKEKNKQLREKIDKAIEYIFQFYGIEEDHFYNAYDFDSTNMQKLYEILRGDN